MSKKLKGWLYFLLSLVVGVLGMTLSTIMSDPNGWIFLAIGSLGGLLFSQGWINLRS